jgi:hypothetical protein
MSLLSVPWPIALAFAIAVGGPTALRRWHAALRHVRGLDRRRMPRE